MTDIPERLRDRARQLSAVDFEKPRALAIATALHEIEQAAERRGAERMREDINSIACDVCMAHPDYGAAIDELAARYWALPLPAPAEPPKEGK